MPRGSRMWRTTCPLTGSMPVSVRPDQAASQTTPGPAAAIAGEAPPSIAGPESSVAASRRTARARPLRGW